MDPLSDILSLLRPRTAYTVGLAASGDWALAFAGFTGIKFNAITRGACWVIIEGAEPIRVEEGDCFLMNRGLPFRFASDPAVAPIEGSIVYDVAVDGVATIGTGDDFFLVGGRFDFAPELSDLLFASLPPVIHVRRASDQASVLRWALDQLAAELRERRPGGALVSEHLAHIMLVQVLRLHLQAQQTAGLGWFQALADRQLSRVVGAMHGDPAHRWTLQEMARTAGMSRSTFAERFKRLVGSSPMDYLTRWRMLVAGDRLRHSADSISSIALGIGYESESAFSTAFKRAMACSPRQFRRQVAPAGGAG